MGRLRRGGRLRVRGGRCKAIEGINGQSGGAWGCQMQPRGDASAADSRWSESERTVKVARTNTHLGDLSG